MPDNDNDNSNDNDEPKTLREKLEAALGREKGYQKTISGLQGQVLMPNLSERQRKIVLRELAEDETEVNEKNVKEVAKDLGFKMEAATTTSTNGSEGQGAEGGDGAGEGAGEGSGEGSESGTETEPPKVDLPRDVQIALEAAGRFDVLHAYGDGPEHDLDFEDEMKGAKTKEELDSILRAKGHGQGLVLEDDIV